MSSKVTLFGFDLRKNQEFPQNLGALVANPFAFSVLLIARSGIARYGSIDPETSLTY
jgi:hypothetical protein